MYDKWHYMHSRVICIEDYGRITYMSFCACSIFRCPGYLQSTKPLQGIKHIETTVLYIWNVYILHWSNLNMLTKGLFVLYRYFSGQARVWKGSPASCGLRRCWGGRLWPLQPPKSPLERDIKWRQRRKIGGLVPKRIREKAAKSLSWTQYICSIWNQSLWSMTIQDTFHLF